MSRGEFDNVARALGGWEKLVNPKAKDKQTLALLDALVDWQKEDKLFENQQLFLTPIVRNGRQATVGYQPDVWKKLGMMQAASIRRTPRTFTKNHGHGFAQWAGMWYTEYCTI